MKPETATAIAVSLLLAGSALCVGVRHAIDTKSERSRTTESRTGTTSHASVEAGKKTPIERPPEGRSDPETMAKRLRAALATANEADRTRALLDLISRFGPDDWPLALEALDGIGVMTGFDLILSAWTESDPEAAMTWAIEKKIEDHVIRAWIGKDPGAAMAYLTSPASGDPSRQWSRMARAIEALGNDLPRIAQLIAATPEKQRLMMTEQTHPKFGKIAPETVKAWVESLDPSLKNHALKLLLTNLEGVEAKLALARDFPDDIGPEKYGSIYKAWMESDEAAAIASLESLEPGPLHRSALFGVVFGLSEKGKLAEAFALTRRWPEEISDGVLSDLMLSGNPKDAAMILAEIPRLKIEPLRLNRYQVALGPWLKEDPEAARKWLRENEVPEQIRKEFEGK